MSEKRVSTRAVVVTAILLLVLWGLSYGLSAFALGAAALPVALAIAVTKAALVIAIFMELGGEPLSMKLSALAAASFVLILVAFMIADVETRDPPPLRVPGAPP
jgi:cytochrome c oxidase subunit 4